MRRPTFPYPSHTHDRHVGQAVAVKAPKHGLNRGSHEEVTMELRHEAKVLSNINHPHVIKFYGSGSVIVGDGHPVFFIVVEILADSLADRLNKKDGKDSIIQSTSQVPHKNMDIASVSRNQRPASPVPAH